ncbi:unnamed protein product [Medioppia subpectinata]|uniref:Cytochrome P450 n=1 Tax=Medioppia subpectinata TaxID=1979941 RepID=A0A7R9KBT2_9ACAR|nr:unnamed protein product [Medioppia subpectinata]CAG2100543.1 unnamed protein product [Medioppia subpectinata]
MAKNALPPGPIGLPFIGYMPFLKGEPSRVFVQLAKKYGPVFGLQMGSQPVVVLNDWPSIKEALSHNSALHRPKHNFFNTAFPAGFAAISGDDWKVQKRFTFHQLKNLGFGKTSMEDHIIDEINHMCQVLDAKEGQELEFRTIFPISVSNNVNSLNFGRRFDYTDSKKKAIDEFLKMDPSINITGFIAFYPILARFLLKYLTFLLPSSLQNTTNIVKGVTDIIRTEYETHVKTFDENNNRDYLDAFIAELRVNKHDNMLAGNAFDLFIGGSATVLMTLEWALLVLATNPQIQQHLHKEIDDVIGGERSPTFADKNQMPFLQAFIASKDMVISGFKIPKDTQILVNFWAIDNDPNLWDNPSEFRPQRFLSENLKTFKKPEHLIPFSYASLMQRCCALGKRSCPGEGLGVVEVFLYLSSLLQKYDIKANHKTDQNLEYEFHLLITPKHNTVFNITKRHKTTFRRADESGKRG